MKRDNIKIYIVAHRPFKTIETCDMFEVIQVNAIHNQIFARITDSIGEDNIANKNINYAELTAIYSIWKNDLEGDYIGLCHYRRYFVTPLGKIMNIFFGNKMKLLTERQIESYLKKNDLIIHNTTYMHNGVKNQFQTWSGGNECDVMRTVVEKLYPEYLYSFDKIMNGKTIHLLNMFIMPRRLFEQYCEWLFAILFEFEKRINGEKYVGEKSRMIAMLSERLLDVWILQNGYKAKKCFTINTERKDLKFWI